MSLSKYWKDNITSGKSVYSIATVIIGGVLILTWPVFLIFGLNGPIQNKVGELLTYGGLAVCIIWALFWLPAKRHQETELEHNKKTDILKTSHAQEISNLQLKYTKEIETVNVEIKLLKDEIDKNSQVKIIAEMQIITGQYKIKVISIKVLNNTNKIIVVEKVMIYLAAHQVQIGGIPAIRSDMTIPAGPHIPVEIIPNGGMSKWQQNAHKELSFNTTQKGDKHFGKGYVLLADNRRFDFEYQYI